MKILLSSAVFLIALACIAQDNTKEPIFTKVEVEAQYQGGDSAWNEFLGKNLDYPYDARVNLIQGKVVVQFTVDTDGNISDIHAISGPYTSTGGGPHTSVAGGADENERDGGLREEAVRVVKLSGKWEPGFQNGRRVRSLRKVTLMFKLSSE
jgi:protein TonB